MPNLEQRPPSPLAMAVLALLHEEPMHPYQVSYKMRERHMDWTIKLKFGSLYHTVEALLRDGLIQNVERGRDGRRPERTVYGLTPRGRQEFLDRLSDMVRLPVRDYNDFAAGLKFISHLDREAAVELLRDRAESLGMEAEHVDKVIRLLREEKRLRRLSSLELEHAAAMARAEIEWITGIANEIESGELEWRAGHLETAQPTSKELEEAR
jgi:DNA-binding PadR family transcriptional regulator